MTSKKMPHEQPLTLLEFWLATFVLTIAAIAIFSHDHDPVTWTFLGSTIGYIIGKSSSNKR